MDILHLTLRQLQIFAGVARAGSTVAASEALALSQSATSAALKELERLLDRQLFDRAGKRLLLNENGRALLPRALALLDGAADIERLARTDVEQLQMLRIGASTTIGNYLLPTLLAPVLDSAAVRGAERWHSRISIANTEAIGRAVAAFALDVAFVEGPVHEPTVLARPWLRDEMVIVGAPGAVGTAAPTLAALRAARWLLREPGSGTREAADRALLPHLRHYTHSIELGSSEAIQHAAALGMGLALLSRWVVDEPVRAGRLCIVDSPLPRIFRPCYLLRHRDKPESPMLKGLLARLRPAAQARA